MPMAPDATTERPEPVLDTTTPDLEIDRQAELRGELEVPLVVPRHRHDGAGAVFH